MRKVLHGYANDRDGNLILIARWRRNGSGLSVPCAEERASCPRAAYFGDCFNQPRSRIARVQCSTMDS